MGEQRFAGKQGGEQRRGKQRAWPADPLRSAIVIPRHEPGHEHHERDHHRQQEVLIGVSRGDCGEQQRGRPDAHQLQSLVLGFAREPRCDEHEQHQADTEEIGGEPVIERVVHVIDV